ncbi:unnamed protein product [Amaranthus hypochondriacus]
MRREGRPHGMVRTYHVLPSPLNPRPNSRILNKIDSPPTAGIFAKISNKPTNHSKFTGKCEKVRCSGCHFHPVSKSRDKSKGTHKLKSSDSAFNYQQVTWRVVGLNKLRKSGYSASGILNELNNHDYDHDYDDHDDHDDEHGDENGGDSYVDDEVKTEILVAATSHHDDIVNVDVDDDDVNDDDVDEIIVHVGVTDDNDDGYMGFYDVSYLMNPMDEDEEGWSVIG